MTIGHDIGLYCLVSGQSTTGYACSVAVDRRVIVPKCQSSDTVVIVKHAYTAGTGPVDPTRGSERPRRARHARV